MTQGPLGTGHTSWALSWPGKHGFSWTYWLWLSLGQAAAALPSSLFPKTCLGPGDAKEIEFHSQARNSSGSPVQSFVHSVHVFITKTLIFRSFLNGSWGVGSSHSLLPKSPKSSLTLHTPQFIEAELMGVMNCMPTQHLLWALDSIRPYL